MTPRPDLQEPPDGTKSLGCTLLPLDRPVGFEHEVDFEPAPPVKLHHRSKGGGIHYNAKVMCFVEFLDGCLFNQLRAAAVYEAAPPQQGGGVHYNAKVQPRWAAHFTRLDPKWWRFCVGLCEPGALSNIRMQLAMVASTNYRCC